MSLYVVQMPSASTNGSGIAIGTSATTLHTAVAGTTQADEVWVWIGNTNSSAVDVTLTVGVNVFTQTLAPKAALQVMLPGVRVNNGTVVSATASIASAAVAVVNVNRITL